MTYAEWVSSMPCGVTSGRPAEVVDVGDGLLFPMTAEAGAVFRSQTEDVFERRYGLSKQWVREMAEDLYRHWRRLNQNALRA